MNKNSDSWKIHCLEATIEKEKQGNVRLVRRCNP